MSYVEEKSYSSNVVRVLKPTTSTTTHHVQSDSVVSDCAALENKIDYLLEDLQKAVPPSYKQSSPGLDDLGSPQRGGMQQQLHNSSYRQEVSQSSSSYGGSGGRRALSPQRLSERQSSSNTNQLDSLLRDLEQERHTVEGDYSGTTKNVYSSNQYNSTMIEPADVYSVAVPTERSHLIEETNDTYGRRKGTNRVITETRTYDGGVLLNDSEFRKDVADQSLSQGILPRPGTKVTTTVRTYTYEVPMEGDSYSTSTTLSRSGVGGRNNLQRIEYSSNTENATDTSTRVRRHNEFRDEVDSRSLHIIPAPGTNRERSVSPNPGSPTNPNSVVTYYKKEYSTSRNVHSDKSPEPYLLPSNHHSPHSPPPPTTNKHPQYPTGTYESRNVYHTTIKNTTTNNNRYPPAENFYHPPPFPTDNNRNGYPNSGTPGRVDDLMASLEINSNDMRTVNEKDIDFERRKEVETAIATSKEPRQPLENIVGPPVYYPPGKKVSIMKEGAGGGGGGGSASAAAGGYAMKGGYERASGRYEYEASSKSKSKSSSGAAVVPVCLPLCCAMPCSIM